MFCITTALKKVRQLTKRIRVVQGGTSASKTISILSVLIHDAQTDTTPTLTSIVSETFPHLRRGAMRDFLNILKTQGYYDDDSWSRTEFIYTFPNGSQIEFFSIDQADKLRGPRRNRLFINEANRVSYDAFTQLEIRTSDYIFADYNPSEEFWYHEHLEGKRDDIDFIILTYKDNEGLHPNVVATIEKRQSNKQWWQVYGLGLLGEITGRIYTGWNIIKEIPHEARLIRYGLDFGYSNDPTALVAVYKYNDGYILDELCYQTEMRNSIIADLIKEQPDKALVIADSAEPKSIAEIKLAGVPIVPCVKGKDSITSGIDKVQDQSISITENSVAGIKEYRNYLWATDRDGKRLNVPEGEDHFLDAVRYALGSIVKATPLKALKDANSAAHKVHTVTGGLLDERF